MLPLKIVVLNGGQDSLLMPASHIEPMNAMKQNPPTAELCSTLCCVSAGAKFNFGHEAC
jgi:hypothetical protein